MNFGNWVVGVVLKFSSNGVYTMQQMNAASRMLNQTLAQQQGIITKNQAAMLAYQRRIEVLRDRIWSLANVITTRLAVAGAAAAAFGVDQAANLEQQLKIYQIATGSTLKQMQAVRDQVFESAYATAQSAANVARQFVAISQMGLPASLMTPKLMDQFIKFGDIINLQSRNQMSAEEAIKIGIKSAHQLGIYSPQGIQQVLTEIARYSFLIPDGLQNFRTQAKYFAPLVATFGSSPQSIDSILSTYYLLDIAGMGQGRGGTSVAATIRQLTKMLQVTSHLQAGKAQILEQMGLLRPDGVPRAVVTTPSGEVYFSMPAFVHGLYDYMHRQTAGLRGEALAQRRTQILSQLEGLFQAQGGLFAALASNKGWEQFENLQQRLQKIPKSIDELQIELLDTFWGSLQKATTGVLSFAAALASPQLKTLEGFLTQFSQMMHNATMWAKDHPTQSNIIMGGLESTVGLWGVFSALRAIRAVARFLGVTSSMAAVGRGAVNVWHVLGGPMGSALGMMLEPMAFLFGKMFGTVSPVPFRSRPGLFNVNWTYHFMHLPKYIGDAVHNAFTKVFGFVSPIPFKSRPGLFGVNWAFHVPRVLGTIGELLLKLGLRAFGIVGWIMLAVDAFNLLKNHGTDFAWVLGKIVGFIANKMWPAIADAFVKGFQTILRAVISGLGAILRSVQTVLTNPVGAVQNVAKWGSGAVQGVQQWWSHIVQSYKQGYNTQVQQKPGITIHNLHVHANSAAEGHAAAHGFTKALRNMQGQIGLGGGIRTSPFLPAPLAVGPGLV